MPSNLRLRVTPGHGRELRQVAAVLEMTLSAYLEQVVRPRTQSDLARALEEAGLTRAGALDVPDGPPSSDIGRTSSDIGRTR